MTGALPRAPAANAPVDRGFQGPSKARGSRVGVPVTPWQPPFLAGLKLVRDGIETRGSTRAAASDAKERHPAAGPQSVAGNRLVPEFGTGGDVTAGIPDEAREGQLVKPDQPRAGQPAGGAGEWPLPVAGPSFRSWMAAVGSLAHVRRRSFVPLRPRSGRAHRRRRRRSAWSMRAAPCSPSPA